MTELPTPQVAPVPAHAPIPSMTGLRKVAYLMITIGTGPAASIMKALAGSDTELQEKIAAEIFQIRSVPAEHRAFILEEAYSGLFSEMGDMEGGQSYAFDLFVEAFGEDRGIALMDRVVQKQQRKRFEFLTKVTDDQVAAHLQQEHPQTIAIVLAHLEARHAANVLGLLPPDLSYDVAERIAATGDRDLPEAAIAQLEDGIRVRVLRNEQAATARVGGNDALAQVLNNIDQSASKAILEDIERRDPGLAADVRKKMFVFDDIIKLDRNDIATIAREIQLDNLATALRGADRALKEAFMGAVSVRVREQLVEEMETGKKTPRSTIIKEQDDIVVVVRRLHEEHKITIPTGDEEYV